MKSPLPLLTGLVVVASGVAVGRNLLTSRQRLASRSEIEAVLPASLKAVDAPDPAGITRYTRLVALVHPLFRTAEDAQLLPKDAAARAKAAAARVRLVDSLAPFEALLAEGGLRVPDRKPGALIPEATEIRALSKAVALCAGDAAKRGDRTECARFVEFDLRLGRSMVEDKGELIDELVAVAMESVANRAAYEAEMAGGLDSRGRTAVLALMPPLDGPMPELGDALRRDFQSSMMPFLTGALSAENPYGENRGLPQGSLDALATARLMGQIDEAQIEDANRPYRLQTREASRIAAKASAGLPNGEGLDDMPEGLEKIWLKFKYRLAVNAQPNALGRATASEGVYDLGTTAARRAAGRNLARAAILLHSGESPRVNDPFGEGTLRIDPKRKLVWSVGENGKDDGGEIGKGGVSGQPDYGYPYAAGAWPPKSDRQ